MSKKKGANVGGHSDADDTGGAPAWVVSFADMSLLLLSFFIMLLAVSSQKTATDEAILKVLAAIKVGFGYTPKDPEVDELDIAVLQVLQLQNEAGIKSQLLWSSPAMKDKAKSTKDKSLWVRVKGVVGRPVFFAEGSSNIPLQSEDTLDQIADVVRHHYRILLIQGHCSLEESRNDPAGGHDLAFSRALAIGRALEKRGIAAARIRVISCADNDTPKETQDNLKHRAVIQLGSWYLPGGEKALQNTPHLRG